MRRLAFNTLLRQLGNLVPRQRAALLDAVRAIGRQDEVVTTIESARAQLLVCPRCACREHRRHGHANGLQRHRCNR